MGPLWPHKMGPINKIFYLTRSSHAVFLLQMSLLINLTQKQIRVDLAIVFGTIISNAVIKSSAVVVALVVMVIIAGAAFVICLTVICIGYLCLRRSAASIRVVQSVF